MPHNIIARGNYNEIVEWLEENIGKVLWSRSIIEWKGSGWSMNLYGYNDTFPYQPASFIVRIDDERLALLCSLRWA